VLGLQESRARVASLLGTAKFRSVLDVGAGTGVYTGLVPANVRYLAVDVDSAKLEGLRRKFPSRETCVADATHLPLPDDSFDCGLFIAVAHHLSDDVLPQALRELKRVLTSRLVFLDPVVSTSLRSRLLWTIDRGSNRRSAATLRDLLSLDFEVLSEEVYSIHHEYFLCIAKPC